MGLLCKFYLNTKQWQKWADMAKQITDLNYYKLYSNYTDLFKVENERNIEFMLVDPQISNGNNYISGAFLTGFYKDPVSDLTMQSNWNNWGHNTVFMILFIIHLILRIKEKILLLPNTSIRLAKLFLC